MSNARARRILSLVNNISADNEEDDNVNDIKSSRGSPNVIINERSSPISFQEPFSPDDSDHDYIPSPRSTRSISIELQDPGRRDVEMTMTRKRKHFQLKEKLSRKRSRNENEWKNKKNGILRQAGESYVTRKGKQVLKKYPKTGTLCKLTCKFNCYEKFDDIDSAFLFTQYYSLKNNDEKNLYLSKFITMSNVQRALTNPKRKRNCTFTYVLPKGGSNIKVCKTAFCNVYQIGFRKISVIQSKVKSNDIQLLKDQRGKASNNNNYKHKIHNEVLDFICKHIQSFPAEMSHYSRTQNMHKKYLNPLLSIKKMYTMYIELCKQEKKSDKYFVKSCSYRNIFNTKFNLSFTLPRTDVCNKCDSNTYTDEHIDNYKTSFNLQKIERELCLTREDMTYVSFDMQQTQPLPKIPISKAFYLRQIWFYNEGIHIINKDGHRSYFCTWTEDCGGKGSVEVLSSLFYCLNNLANIQSAQHLLLWSDSCSGQNKNQFLIVLYQYMILNELFVTIEHKFPEVGHTFLDCDRDFGRIEKVLRKHEKIFTADQYRNIIRSASSKKSVVDDMDHHFYDFNKLKEDLGITIPLKNTLKEKINFKNNVKWIHIEDFGRYLYKTNYDPFTPFLEVCLTKDSDEHPTVSLACDINHKGKISKEKVADIKSQLEYVEKESQWYYQKIIQNY